MKRTLLACGAALATAAGLPASAAAASPAPAWKLEAVPQPTSFSASDFLAAVLELRVSASAGKYTLSVEGAETKPIARNAPAATVQAALDALATIAAGGGSVTVTGGPGDASGSKPYVIAVNGLAGKEVQIQASAAGLTGTATVNAARHGAFGDRYTILLTNAGGATANAPVTLIDKLPSGITLSGAPESKESAEGAQWECPGAEAGASEVTCTYAAAVSPLTHAPALFLPVEVAPEAAGALADEATVSGGLSECGEPEHPPCPLATAGATTTLGAPAPPFALLGFVSQSLDPGGGLATQAGSHPAGLLTSFDIPSRIATLADTLDALPVENVRRIVIDLPAGVVGNAQAAPTCALSDLANFGACPAATQVGELSVVLPPRQQGGARNLPIFNVTPEGGHPAEFGVFEPAVKRAVLLYASVRTGSDYGVRVASAPTPEAIPVNGVSATFFGNPAQLDKSGNAPLAFFTNPTDCSAAAFTTTVHADTWQHPGREVGGVPDFSDPSWKASSSQAPPVTGCDALAFRPEIEFAAADPEPAAADSPLGLHVRLRIPQNEAPSGLASPPLQYAVVKLPPGVAVSPAAANGLAACSPEQIGLASAAPASCPQASAVGSVEITTPALKQPLKGSVFTAQQNANPFGSLLAIYVVAEGSGVVVKLAGHVEADPATGQLTTRFEGNPPFNGLPQQPFSELKLDFFGGPRAALIAPPACGTYPVSTQLTPWSSRTPAEPAAGLTVASRCGAAAFNPSFSAGTSNNQAAAFSPLSVTFSRQDGEQRLASAEVRLPPGLLGVIRSVAQCPEPQAAQGTCGPASLIGHTTTAAGPGTQPVYVGGNVFLTGPYRGAPFGLSIVVRAVAGPFDLGTVVVRAAVAIDPHTAQVRVLSDPLPTILQGIPLDIKLVNVTIDRPGFVLNPTNCAPLSVTGVLRSTAAAEAAVATPFQAANCATLPFTPSFGVAVDARTSRARGASLHFTIASGPGQANIGKVRFQFPRQLPSRLGTLQKACLDTVFAANPAACPEASVIGTAVAHTPLLSGALSGPIYLVSHGGAAFPDAVIVLQGEGILLDVVGNTDIKRGITSTTFSSVPDAPISSFDATLPAGPHSAFTGFLPTAARESFCGQAMSMPTTLTGQNGAMRVQSTKVTVLGCPRRKARHRGHRHHVKRAPARHRR